MHKEKHCSVCMMIIPFHSIRLLTNFGVTAVYLGVGEELMSILGSTHHSLQLTHSEVILKNIMPEMERYVN